MTLQTSGAISLLDIQNEFGGSNPISLSEYYGVDSGIPSSGQISIGDFYGTSALDISIVDSNINGFDFTSPYFAEAGIKFYTTGLVRRIVNGNEFDDQEWGTPTQTGLGNAYHIRAILNSGSTPSGSVLNTWLALSSDREWAIQRTINGVTTSNLTIAISGDGGSSILTQAVFNLEANVETGA